MRIPADFWLGCLVLITLGWLSVNVIDDVGPWPLICGMGLQVATLYIRWRQCKQRYNSTPTQSTQNVLSILRELASIQRLLPNEPVNTPASRRLERLSDGLSLKARLDDKHPLQLKPVSLKHFWQLAAHLAASEGITNVTFEPCEHDVWFAAEPRMLAQAIATWASNQAKAHRCDVALQATTHAHQIVLTCTPQLSPRANRQPPTTRPSWDTQIAHRIIECNHGTFDKTCNPMQRIVFPLRKRD